MAADVLIPETAVMVGVELVSVPGRRLYLGQASTSADEGLWSFAAELTGETYRASIAVWELGDGLAVYFDQLASRWRGFYGPLTYTSLENALTLDGGSERSGAVCPSFQRRRLLRRALL